MGVPGSKIGLREANVSYNSLEQENIAYVQDTIQPRCVHIEEEFDAKALAEDSADDIRFKFELKSRLRVTLLLVLPSTRKAFQVLHHGSQSTMSAPLRTWTLSEISETRDTATQPL